MSYKKIEQALENQAQNIFQNSLEILQQGKSEEADTLLLKAHRLNPKNIDALNLLGIRFYQKQDYKNALYYLNSSNEIEPSSAHTLCNLGLVHNAMLEFQSALQYCDQAIKKDPDIPEAHNNRGNALKGLGQRQEAINAYAKAIALRPNYGQALSNQGVVYLEQGMLDKAAQFFKKAINANPNLAEAFNGLANAHTLLGNSEDAFKSFGDAIQINPNYLDAYLNFGNSLKKFKQYEHAIQSYQYALKINPQYAKIYYLLGELYYDIGNYEKAKSYLVKSLSLDASDIESKYALGIAQIPKVAESAEQLAASRKYFSNELTTLETTNAKTPNVDIASKVIARHPFYLAYQIENNEPLISKFGSICVQQAKIIQNKLSISNQQSKANKKIRVGIVSHFFCNHPVWHAITKGWVNHLNPDVFEIYLFNTGGTEDDETGLAKLKALSYINCGNSVESSAQFIIDQNLDAVLYPEIGMDTTSKALACLRLAPLQAVSWGHPETTGLPTIDFFLSGALLEPAAAKNYYKEELIALPNLGTYIEEPSVAIADPELQKLGIDLKLPILLCAGSPSKYTPSYDEILVEIAKRLGKCQFVFFNFEENLVGILKKRLHQVFLNAQLEPEQFIKFIPFLKRDAFYGLMRNADLFLDTIGFSGFNTAIQALVCDLPIVTVEGNWMRGRLASAILNRLGVPELICHTKQNYIDMVVELIKSPPLLESYKTTIATKRHILFHDSSPIRALENFLLSHRSIA